VAFQPSGIGQLDRGPEVAAVKAAPGFLKFGVVRERLAVAPVQIAPGLLQGRARIIVIRSVVRKRFPAGHISVITLIPVPKIPP
jgi:hypothetical protein